MMWLSRTLVLIGALNWGLIGFFKFDLIATLFGGQMAPVSRIVYAAVGVAAVWMIVGLAGRTDAPVRDER